eukprot:TRINITY_DN9306_c0_g2_i1.p2 TRINITY_DN9306_c0_g2~~TRINITY_DN9306_c0_g2_i1.p2  ORF type:complete len:151 (+),score=13.39 TRINITY_DN9306_c0_g2_i1:522-974(+)
MNAHTPQFQNLLYFIEKHPSKFFSTLHRKLVKIPRKFLHQKLSKSPKIKNLSVFCKKLRDLRYAFFQKRYSKKVNLKKRIFAPDLSKSQIKKSRVSAKIYEIQGAIFFFFKKDTQEKQNLKKSIFAISFKFITLTNRKFVLTTEILSNSS